MKSKYGSTPKLTRKLVKLFIISGVFLIVSAVLTFKLFNVDSYKKTLSRNVELYITLIVDKYEKGEISSNYLMKRDISLKKINASNAKKYIDKEFKDLKFKFKSDSFSLGHRRGQMVSVLSKDNFVYFMTASSYDSDRNLYSLIVVVILIILTLFLVHRRIRNFLRPLDKIKESSIRYGEGDLNYIIGPYETREFQEVADSINEMRSKIKDMLDSKRTLLLSIGHELRTPLTRQKINCEMIREEIRRDSILEDIEEMELIIDSLLESERTQTYQSLNLKLVSITELLAPFESMKINLDDDSKEIYVDKSKIQLALKNIVNNAKKYAGGVTEIRVNTRDGLSIEIIDSGDGIEDKYLSSLTEAFFRPDSARTRSKGGVGLGLYIAAQVIKAHGGDLSFKNNLDTGGLKVKVSI